MSPGNGSTLAPGRRSPSHTCRWIAGSATRRRSRRGGKSPAGSTPPGTLRTLLPLLPHQEAVGQHHSHGVAVEPRPQPPLILVPAQQPLALLVVLLHPVTPIVV